MLGELKAQRALHGFRAATVDLGGWQEVSRNLEFADDQRGRIAELDVNPLICAGERIIAVDALIARPASKP
jgi:acetyl-CoA synthetase